MDHLFEIEKAQKKNMKDILTFVQCICEKADIDTSTCLDVKLAVEEICMNLISYAYEKTGPGPIRLKIQIDESRIIINIYDQAPPFDPEDAPIPDICADVDDMKIGGLGLFIVQQIMDDITYTPDTEEWNVLTLIKRLKNK